MKKLTIYMAFAAALITGCKKTDFDETINGEALGSFRLTSPATATNLVLNSATPSATVNITWTAAKAGVSKAPTYTWVAALKTGGSLESPALSIPANNSGAATTLTLTQKQIDDALAAKSIAVGAKTDFIWSVVADNGSTKVQSQDVFTISITRMQDGATPFILLGPESSVTTKEINPSSTTDVFKFNWTRSTPTSSSKPITYKVWFYKDDATMAPLFSVSSNNNGADSLLTINYKSFSDSLTKYGYTNLSDVAKLKWSVTATSGTWSIQSNYTNQLYVLREVKVFIVGSATPGGWDIAKSTQLIPDNRFSGLYISYIYLTAGNEFKFVNGQVWPPAVGAVDWGQDPAAAAGTLTANNESNIPVTTTGMYRVTVDLTNNKFYVQTGSMGSLGLVGQFQSWSPPGIKMASFNGNRLITITNMSTNDGFKFHDGSDWTNGTITGSRWFGLDAADGNKLKIDLGSYSDIKWTGNNGPVRVIFDGADVKNLTYSLTPASEMRVVGDGINQAGVNDWDPPTSPQMTYTGNGKWTISITLKANKDIKFLAGNAWGAFDYEDNSGQSNTTGTPRSIKWDGSNNFKTPATAGTYTITLDEYAQTVTIN